MLETQGDLGQAEEAIDQISGTNQIDEQLVNQRQKIVDDFDGQIEQAQQAVNDAQFQLDIGLGNGTPFGNVTGGLEVVLEEAQKEVDKL